MKPPIGTHLYTRLPRYVDAEVPPMVERLADGRLFFNIASLEAPRGDEPADLTMRGPRWITIGREQVEIDNEGSGA